jgi:hypothetical protein
MFRRATLYSSSLGSDRGGATACASVKKERPLPGAAEVGAASTGGAGAPGSNAAGDAGAGSKIAASATWLGLGLGLGSALG